jgi:SNF2 family DNA or RNA helicase
MKYPYPFKTRPYDHQFKAWDISKDLEAYALFMEMGTGKTKVILDTAAWLYDNGKIDAVMIFANKGSYMNWETKEIPAHMPDHIKRFVFSWGDESKSQTEKNIAMTEQGKFGLTFFVMNIEALAYESGKKAAERFIISRRCLAVVDESSNVKNPKAHRTKAAIQVAKFAKYRRILTGSPITNSPLDIYSQCQFLGHNILGFGSFYTFRAYFADLMEMRMAQGNRAYTFKKVVRYKNLDELTDILKKFSFIIKKDECLDLPPKVYEICEVPMTKEQKEMYKKLKDEAMLELAGVPMVTAPLVIVRLLRLHQLVCGCLDGDDGELLDIPCSRIEALESVLEEAPGKVIIWATYRKNIAQITKLLSEKYGKEKVVMYFGDTTGDERTEAIKKFQDGGADYFVGNPRTGGYGITLTAASTVVYFSNDYNLETRLQSEDRCHRIGQTKSVTYVDLVSRGTVDEKILKALKEKKSVADSVIVSNWRELF